MLGIGLFLIEEINNGAFQFELENVNYPYIGSRLHFFYQSKEEFWVVYESLHCKMSDSYTCHTLIFFDSLNKGNKENIIISAVSDDSEDYHEGKKIIFHSKHELFVPESEVSEHLSKFHRHDMPLTAIDYFRYISDVNPDYLYLDVDDIKKILKVNIDWQLTLRTWRHVLIDNVFWEEDNDVEFIDEFNKIERQIIYPELRYECTSPNTHWSQVREY